MFENKSLELRENKVGTERLAKIVFIGKYELVSAHTILYNIIKHNINYARYPNR